jgi:glutamyl-tRNA synthetase
VAPDASYIGRLAPSPTGEYHLGNLSTSLLAWIRARRAGGRLILRDEDIDRPRVIAGASGRIIDDLRWLGIEWDCGPDRGSDGGPYVQSQRMEQYLEASRVLRDRGALYPCFCSRRDVHEVLSAPHFEATRLQYPGTCALLEPAESWARASSSPHALRFRALGTRVVHDALAGDLRVDIAAYPGDPVLVRRDGLPAYHLAVVVDDLAMGVTEVVRGRDLLDVTPLQIAIAEALGGVFPATCHAPMLVDADGGKLSKRFGSAGRARLVEASWCAAELRGAFAWLWGWIAGPEPLAADELLGLWQDAPLRRDAIAVPLALLDGPAELRRWARANHRGVP